jgi:hypothetical protein
MKKYFGYLILFSTLIACNTEVEFNNPAFEGQKDNVFWRAIDTKAFVRTDGSLTINAYTKNEKVTLITVSKTPQTYFLGTSNSNTASYVLTDDNGTITFATGFGIGDGEIVIEEFDAINNTVTGTFKFNAENIYNNPLAGPTLNFQYGHFYKIPIIGLDSIDTTSPLTP